MLVFLAGNNFLRVILGTSLVILRYLKLLSQTSKVVTYITALYRDVLGVTNNYEKA